MKLMRSLPVVLSLLNVKFAVAVGAADTVILFEVDLELPLESVAVQLTVFEPVPLNVTTGETPV